MKDTVIKVSKSRIMKAIRTEPFLLAGHWANYSGEELVGDKNCSVCAVGSVLRDVLDENQNAEMITKAANKTIDYTLSVGPRGGLEALNLKDIHESAKCLANIGMYMNALSTYFESLWEMTVHRNRRNDNYNSYNLSRHQVYRIRQKLLKFVQAEFPSSIEINIDGAIPKKGVKVVS